MKEQRTMDDKLYDVHYEPAYIEDSIKSDTCNCAIDYKVRRHKNIDTYRVFRHPRVCTQCESTKLLWHNLQLSTHETLDSPLLGVHACSQVLSMLYPDELNQGLPF